MQDAQWQVWHRTEFKCCLSCSLKRNDKSLHKYCSSKRFIHMHYFWLFHIYYFFRLGCINLYIVKPSWTKLKARQGKWKSETRKWVSVVFHYPLALSLAVITYNTTRPLFLNFLGQRVHRKALESIENYFGCAFSVFHITACRPSVAVSCMPALLFSDHLTVLFFGWWLILDKAKTLTW